jgi:Ser/Thr protein kinase RdoA (MazF antagonist)
LGIYIHSAQGWNLIGAPLSGKLPACVEHQDFSPSVKLDDKERQQENRKRVEPLNAFAWAGHSTKRVLATSQMSDVWRERIVRCGHEFRQAIDDSEFKGICLVPILDLNDTTRSLGILLSVFHGDCAVRPAHLFILSRLGSVLSGYLTARMPFPGFPWWPKANLDRGEATVEPKEFGAGANPNPEDAAARRFAEMLMPYHSTVHVVVMERGQSGSGVYQLSVTDAERIKEIPRVLKIGKEEKISDELRNYSRWVHNKRVGGASRIDVALRTKVGDEYRAAIVYNLVGAGDDDAEPWEKWAQSLPLNDVDEGLGLLQTQLKEFYRPRKSYAASAATLILSDTLAYLKRSTADKLRGPTLLQVRKLVEKGQKTLIGKRHETPTCVVHNDLHSRNIFALTGSDSSLRGVALIDWGSMEEGRHPLSDIARLLVDLCYKVRWGKGHLKNWKWAKKTIQSWGDALDVGKSDWKVALLHQMATMLFWTDPIYFAREARAQVWKDMQELVS